jgi:hypothetical protein
MALTPDGKTLWVPSFGGPHWYVVDAATGKLIKDLQTPATGGAHNTIVSLDGTKAFLAGLGSKIMSIADARTDNVIQTVGPFSGNVRPFTVNGAGTLIYANVDDLLGFQIGDARTGKVIQTGRRLRLVARAVDGTWLSESWNRFISQREGTLAHRWSEQHRSRFRQYGDAAEADEGDKDARRAVLVDLERRWQVGLFFDGRHYRHDDKDRCRSVER